MLRRLRNLNRRLAVWGALSPWSYACDLAAILLFVFLAKWYGDQGATAAFVLTVVFATSLATSLCRRAAHRKPYEFAPPVELTALSSLFIVRGHLWIGIPVAVFAGFLIAANVILWAIKRDRLASRPGASS